MVAMAKKALSPKRGWEVSSPVRRKNPEGKQGTLYSLQLRQCHPPRYLSTVWPFFACWSKRAALELGLESSLRPSGRPGSAKK